MEAKSPITDEDLVPLTDAERDAEVYDLSDEELAELDRRVAEADRLSAAGVALPTAQEFFAQQRAKFRIAS